MSLTLLTSANPKIQKGENAGYLTFILHLAPASLSGHNVCAKASAGCIEGCLNLAGRGKFTVIQNARIRKTQFFFDNRAGFMETLVNDIKYAIRYAEKKGFIPVFRLNGTSDIAWEKYPATRDGVEYRNIFEAFSGVQFYDYTKILGRKVKHISNYHLTFSRAENNQFDCYMALENGMNVAAVFSTRKGDNLPETYMGRIVFNGDNSDLRFLDPKGVIVGLYAKGKAKKDNSGFVVQV